MTPSSCKDNLLQTIQPILASLNPHYASVGATDSAVRPTEAVVVVFTSTQDQQSQLRGFVSTLAKTSGESNSTSWRFALGDDFSQLGDIEAKADMVVALNTLYTACDYKSFLIRTNKLLKADGIFVSVDFLAQPNTSTNQVEQSSLEIDLLHEFYGYQKKDVNNQSTLTAKLDKYCFKHHSFQDLTPLFPDLLSPAHPLYLKLHNKSITLTKLITKKQMSNGSNLEPRVRDSNGYRPRASAIIYHKTVSGEVEVMMLKRREIGWTLPGGGVEAGEGINEAVLREIFEECGVRGKVMVHLGLVQCQVRKTLTECFIVECIKEESEYPENDRVKRWVSLDELKPHYANLEKTDFFGRKNGATKEMFKMAWTQLEAL